MTTDQALAQKIDSLLAAKHGDVQKPSPLAGLGLYFVAFGSLYGIDPRLAVAVAGAETTYATDPHMGPDLPGHNAWGYGGPIPGHRTIFASWKSGIFNVDRTLATAAEYANVDRIYDLGPIWVNGPKSTAPPPTGWIATVSAVVKQLGRDPRASYRSTPFA